jgi:tetratricopeptide (TPR) repeat protein
MDVTMAKIPAALARAAVLHLQGRVEEALAEIETAIAAGESSAALLAARQQLSAQRGCAPAQTTLVAEAEAAFVDARFEDAAEHCARLAEMSPDQAEPWFNLGVAYERSGRAEEAAAAYREAARRNPRSAAALVNLGALLHQHGELDEAASCYQRALKIEPGHRGALYNAGVLVEQQGEADPAEAFYAQCEWEGAWFRLGLLRLRRGDYQGAIQALTKCISQRAEWPEAEFNLALARWKAGEPQAAADGFSRLLERDPNSLHSLRALAAVHIELNLTEQALDLHARLIESGERTPELFYNTGLLLQKSGQIDDAVKLYNEAVSEREGFREALINLGHAVAAQGDMAGAEKYWAAASRAEND